MKRFAATVAVLFVASAAQASEWRSWGPAGKSPMRKVWFADRASVQTVGGNKRVWIQVINETLDGRAKSMKMFAELDCAGKRDRTLAITIFGTNGLIGENETPGAWSYTAPDSPIDTISKAVCTNDWRDTDSFGYTPDIVAQSMFDVIDKNGSFRPKHR